MASEEQQSADLDPVRPDMTGSRDRELEADTEFVPATSEGPETMFEDVLRTVQADHEALGQPVLPSPLSPDSAGQVKLTKLISQLDEAMDSVTPRGQGTSSVKSTLTPIAADEASPASGALSSTAGSKGEISEAATVVPHTVIEQKILFNGCHARWNVVVDA